MYVISNMEDEHLNATYWLANPVLDEADIEPALIAVDMEDICRRYMPDFNLEEELKKSKQSTEELSMKPRRIKHGLVLSCIHIFVPVGSLRWTWTLMFIHSISLVILHSLNFATAGYMTFCKPKGP